MAAYENYYTGKFEHYEFAIYLGRDLDLDILNTTGEVVPGKIVDTQLYVELNMNGTVLKKDTIYGDLVAGEYLRDCIGYGPAKDLLTEMNIPNNSLMWRLGKKG